MVGSNVSRTTYLGIQSASSTLNRSSTFVLTLFTFCPPAPELLAKVISSLSSGTNIFSGTVQLLGVVGVDVVERYRRPPVCCTSRAVGVDVGIGDGTMVVLGSTRIPGVVVVVVVVGEGALSGWFRRCVDDDTLNHDGVCGIVLLLPVGGWRWSNRPRPIHVNDRRLGEEDTKDAANIRGVAMICQAANTGTKDRSLHRPNTTTDTFISDDRTNEAPTLTFVDGLMRITRTVLACM